MEWIIEANDIEEAAEGKFAFVRQVVRCKDCEFKDGVCCDYSAVYVRDNGYCNWGRRRE